MIKKISTAIVVLALTASCVSKKVYTDLENKYTDLKKENRKLQDEGEDCTKAKNELDLANTALQSELGKTKSERDKLLSDYTASDKNLKTLQASYNALEKNSDEALETNMNKNRELLAQLELKQKALANEQERWNKLKGDLQASSQRLSELESLMTAKDASMKKLKETLSKALNSFEGKGLTVQQKNGKVYVSMENKLLFSSGSWAVGAEGRRAVVEVGKVLAANPDISVLIEGHTDDDAYGGSGPIADNWDLSTKRATVIVNVLGENKTINKQNLTAAGRSEFAPLASNATPDGKAKNRRIEIILTPKLDEISKMLNEL
ncbi:OmpA/MotB family protein [Flavobacterium psychrotolerans]|uniref:Cell envelope biogenesis protein OmpA n=1 Tax=Flavobacterium psychrotolerans TaxID=2169410 RepID=A0A2U1JJ88_9FLAO|nr:OmpA family protein [Flavobacterium psychrotolerans]PWA05207.1 cell envelope biogenesis protein OmpA [Flavobacterium psychrotolerans]